MRRRPSTRPPAANRAAPEPRTRLAEIGRNSRFMSEGVQPQQDPTPKRGFYVLKIDGGITAEQGAAGPAAIGVVLKDHKYRDVDQVSQPIGWARNHHEAEYKALIAGLELARRHGIDRIRVFSDSALVVNTVNDDWNLQPEHLKDLCVKAGLLVKEFADIKLSWVPREMNLEADTLASRALGRGR
jgi:ribonuclease HI